MYVDSKINHYNIELIENEYKLIIAPHGFNILQTNFSSNNYFETKGKRIG